MYKTNICQEIKTPLPVMLRLLLGCWVPYLADSVCLPRPSLLPHTQTVLSKVPGRFLSTSHVNWLLLSTLTPSVCHTFSAWFILLSGRLVLFTIQKQCHKKIKGMNIYIYNLVFGENLVITFLQHNPIFLTKLFHFCRRHHARFIWFSNNCF